MSVIAIIAAIAIVASSPVAQCHPTTISTLASTPTPSSEYEYPLQRQYRPSLRNLLFSGFYLLRPSLAESEIQTVEMKPVPEIDSNEIPVLEIQSEETTMPPQPSSTSPIPSPPVSIFSRFSSLKSRLSLDKAIVPAIPVVHEVSSDQVVKKIIFTAPRLSDTITDINMTE